MVEVSAGQDSHEYCKEPYLSNCAYRDTHCESCKGSTGKGRLFYRAIATGIGLDRHPMEKQVDKVARQYARKGRQIERQVVEAMGATPTYNSGATNGDEDGWLEHGGVRYQISHKYRFTKGRNELGPTGAEWNKDIIHVTTSERYGSVVTLHMDLFRELIGSGI